MRNVSGSSGKTKTLSADYLDVVPIAFDVFEQALPMEDRYVSKYDFHTLFLQMVGGDKEFFFQNYWRKRVLFSQAAIPQTQFAYSYEHFMQHYHETRPLDQSLVVTIDDNGKRKMVRPTDDWATGSGLEGASLVLQALLLPETISGIPEIWQRFRQLHYDLCAYLLPGFPQGAQPDGAVAAVDLFCTSQDSSTGGHYDTGDVFYFVLDGEKEWTLELEPDPQTVLRLFSIKGKYMEDHPTQKEHIVITIKPGDCLYVPPFTYHRVRSHGQSLAVSIGLPAYTEATLLKVALERIQREWLIWKPLPSYPDAFTHLSHNADEETRTRILHMLDAMKQAVPATRE